MIYDINILEIFSIRLVKQLSAQIVNDSNGLKTPIEEIADKLEVTKRTVHNYINLDSEKIKINAYNVVLTLTLLAYMSALENDKRSDKQKLNEFIIKYGLLELHVDYLAVMYHRLKKQYNEKQ